MTSDLPAESTVQRRHLTRLYIPLKARKQSSGFHSRFETSKGDVVIIPAGVPHGFSAIEKSITYEVVRVDSGKILPLK